MMAAIGMIIMVILLAYWMIQAMILWKQRDDAREECEGMRRSKEGMKKIYDNYVETYHSVTRYFAHENKELKEENAELKNRIQELETKALKEAADSELDNDDDVKLDDNLRMQLDEIRDEIAEIGVDVERLSNTVDTNSIDLYNRVIKLEGGKKIVRSKK